MPRGVPDPESGVGEVVRVVPEIPVPFLLLAPTVTVPPASVGLACAAVVRRGTTWVGETVLAGK